MLIKHFKLKTKKGRHLNIKQSKQLLKSKKIGSKESVLERKISKKLKMFRLPVLRSDISSTIHP